MLGVYLIDDIVQVLLSISITVCHPQWKFTECVLIMFLRGSIYNENKIWPSREPCGTPWLSLVPTDDSSLICTNWNRSEKGSKGELTVGCHNQVPSSLGGGYHRVVKGNSQVMGARAFPWKAK